MLWELCILWNIWVCDGKRHDALHDQTDYTKTESDLGGTVDSWVGMKPFNFCRHLILEIE